MVLGSVILALGGLWFIGNPYSMISICINAISVGLGVSITFVMMNTNRNKIVDLIEKNEGYRLDNILPTMDVLVGKIAAAIATQFIAFSLSWAGYDANLHFQLPSVINVIINILGWGLFCTAILMGFISLFINIDGERNIFRKCFNRLY
jgi:Na+/melibiose symporter-like transporter